MGNLAPNGKKSNLSTIQYKLVRTAAFKKWFGDWENDPKNASKVVDENGEPLVVWHGSIEYFNEFKKDKIGSASPLKDKIGFFFTNSLEEAKEYGDVKKYFLSIRNPFIDDTNDKYHTSAIYYWDMRKNVYLQKSINNDGIIIYSSASNMYVSIEPTQIKLADGTNTTFDGEDPDIRYEEGGLLAPNDKPSNLTPEQYKLVRTPEFKAWFGDWENEPENSSKVIDDNGEPLVVYHGTNVKEQFYIFDLDKADLGFHFGTYQQANNRSETKIGIKGYKKIITSYFLNIRQLFSITDIGEFEYPQRYLNELLSDNLITEKESKENGFFNAYYREDNKIIRDFLVKKYENIGFEYNNQYESKGKSFITLNNNQMKLADGSNTTFDANNTDIRYEQGGLLAPNGKPSNLTPEQYKLVRTPEFKAWFGDWENDPNNASKVIDENGEPLLCYHYSPNDFTIFDKTKHPQFIDVVENKKHKPLGYDFSTKEGFYESKTRNKKYSVFLNAKNVFDFSKATENEYQKIIKLLSKIPYYSTHSFQLDLDIKYLKSGDWGLLERPTLEKYFSKNYDGLFMKENDWLNIKVYNSNQIKLADGTNTTFDGNNPDIRYKQGGSLSKTPSPLKDRIKGSKVNKEGSASSNDNASKIDFSDKIITTLKNKMDEYNEKHPKNKVSLPTLKAVFRRGAGAYSNSHRPTITGGKPNSRSAWAFARVNKFLLKKGGTNVKSAYVQDDDLMEKGGEITWDEYVKTQFDENENRYLPENYFEDFNIEEGKKQDYPTILKEKDGLEYRKWKYGGIGVFDENKKVAFADNGSIQVTPLYQKKGIGIELVSLLKELNLSHRFGNMTPQGWNLMRSYYNKKNPDGGLTDTFDMAMENLKKNGIVLNDNAKTTTLIAYNTGNQEMQPSLYNKALIYNSVEPIRIANEIIANFDASDFEIFDERKINEYKNSNLIIMNQNEVIYDSNDKYAKGGKIPNDLRELPYLDKGYQGAEYWSFSEDEEKQQKSDRWFELMFQHQKDRIKLTKQELEEFKKLSYELEIEDYEEGGETDDYNVIIYHEKQGNWLIAKNTIYAWVYEDGKDASQKLQSGEYDYVFFPPNMRNSFQSNYVPPLQRVWTKKFQKNNKGSDKLLGIVKAYYDEQENKLYIMMMTTRKDVRRKGINSYIVKTIRENFDLEKDQVVFDKPTKEGIKFMDSGKYHLGGDMSMHLAPNGKPSNLTHEQWHLVRTPEFKAWFGDWENEPENASQVVDENGEPLVCYHRTKKKFTIFDIDKQLNGWLGKGFYFSEGKLEFKNYGKFLLSVFLNIKKPFIVKGDSPTDFLYELRELLSVDKFDTTQKLKENKYDGVIYKHWDYEGKMICCFNSTQIKLADGRNKTFDSNNPDIRYEQGGELNWEAQMYVDILHINPNQPKYKELLKRKYNIDYDLDYSQNKEPLVPRKDRSGQTIIEDSWLLTKDEYNKENISVHSGDNLKRKKTPLETYFQNNVTNVQHKYRVQMAIDNNKYEEAIKNGQMTRKRANEIIKSALGIIIY